MFTVPAVLGALLHIEAMWTGLIAIAAAGTAGPPVMDSQRDVA
jgi:hypothetical protein